MSMYRNVTSKPWLSPGMNQAYAKPAIGMPDKQVALIVMMSSITIVFTLMVVTYFLRRQLGDWVPLAVPSLLWINTGILLASSIVFQLSVHIARDRSPEDATAKWLFALGGLLALAFIGGQSGAWQMMVADGFTLTSSPAVSFFYLLTGLHAVHLAGGLWVWGRTVWRAYRTSNDQPAARDLFLSMKLCTSYWHFLFLVWIGIFILQGQ